MRKVLIIGGGFSGALVATHLLHSNSAFDIIMVDKKGSQGRGVAYATGSSVPLLNVHTGSMSAFNDRPNHFLDWLRKFQPHATESGFAPRTLYGDYLEWVLTTAISENTTGSFQRMVDEVIDVESLMEDGRTKYRAYLRGGQEILVDAVVLAIGNFPPTSLPGTTEDAEFHKEYFGNPWNSDWLRGLDSVQTLLVIGTGLTAVDVIMQAASFPNFSGVIRAVSRHGRMPLCHSPGLPKHGTSPLLGTSRSLREMLSLVRALVRHHQDAGGHWQDIMNDIRPSVGRLWQSLTLDDQKRFLRHLRPLWDLHRHRIAPEVGNTLEALKNGGKLTVYAGQITSILCNKGQLEVTFQSRATRQKCALMADRIVNCSGPRIEVHKIESQILTRLLERGLAVTDTHGIGIRCSSTGAIITKHGGVSHMYTLGSTRRGELWESLAVRELRVQAMVIAGEVATLVGSRDASHPNRLCQNIF